MLCCSIFKINGDYSPTSIDSYVGLRNGDAACCFYVGSDFRILDYFLGEGEGTAVAVRVMQHPQLEQLKQLNFSLNNV